jgi:hypothetical protein
MPDFLTAPGFTVGDLIVTLSIVIVMLVAWVEFG